MLLNLAFTQDQFAQLGEHATPNGKVAGSIPLMGNIFRQFYRRNFYCFRVNLFEVAIFVLYTVAAIGQWISPGDEGGSTLIK